MMTLIDSFLNRTTMFRLIAYYLLSLLAVSVVLSAVHILPFDPFNVVASAVFLVSVCWLSNAVFARIWSVPTNTESALITGLILSLIISPAMPDASYAFLLSAGLLAMASKYILAIRGKHIFNPAAFGVAATALILNDAATWWVAGNIPLMAFVVLGGLLIVRKIHRFDLVFSYIVFTVVSSLAFSALSVQGVLNSLQTIFTHTTLLFFAFVMITEPLTTPPRRAGRIAYGALVGVLSAPWAHIGSLYFTPELALVAGNIFSYGISPKYKAVLVLKETIKLATDTYEFVFSGRAPRFKPGQYAEWTLKANSSDARGNRRYFTLASSPTENEVRIGVKFYPNPSTYKMLLDQFSNLKSTILMGSIAGDFTLPRNKKKKLVFIAGGIGVTPFRSMVKYMVDKKESRDVVLFYSNKTEGEIAYRNIFDAAQASGSGFRAVYTLTDKNTPATWLGPRGFVDAAMIQREVPDFKERIFYISGPHGMVDAFKKTLHDMGVSRFNIKADYFPGFA